MIASISAVHFSATLEILKKVSEKLSSFDGESRDFFKEEIAKSLDSVIKDLATEALAKDLARALKKDIFEDEKMEQ